MNARASDKLYSTALLEAFLMCVNIFEVYTSSSECDLEIGNISKRLRDFIALTNISCFQVIQEFLQL